jgi:hypothetical protein
VVNAHDIPPRQFSDENGRLRTEAVQEFASQGATLVIHDIGSFVPAIGELTAAMERDLRCKVAVNAYLTFGAVSAFIPHSDAHDVLVLQVHGAKLWRSFGCPLPFPLKGTRPRVGEAEWEGRLAPGDLLYLPRGEVHAAVPETLPSVHLTIGLTEATGVDLLQWLQTRAADSQALRQGVAASLAAEGRQAREQNLVAALHDLIDGATVADFLADQDRERPLRSFVVLQVEGVFTPQTRLCSALRRRLDLAADKAGEVLLVIGTRRVRLCQLSRRALVEVTRRHQVTVAALAGALGQEPDGAAFILCLEDLARKALIAIVDSPAASQ